MIDEQKRKRKIRRTAQFKKEYKKAKKQGRDIAKAEDIIGMLADDIPLPEKYRDHALEGDWKGHRECHINPDWLLIYRKSDDGKLMLVLVRINTHSELDL